MALAQLRRAETLANKRETSYCRLYIYRLKIYFLFLAFCDEAQQHHHNLKDPRPISSILFCRFKILSQN